MKFLDQAKVHVRSGDGAGRYQQYLFALLVETRYLPDERRHYVDIELVRAVRKHSRTGLNDYSGVVLSHQRPPGLCCIQPWSHATRHR